MCNINRIFELNERINALKREQEFLNCQLCTVRKKRGERCHAYKYIELLRTKTASECRKLCSERLRLFELISKIEKDDLRTILEYRYIYSMTCEDIAELTNYSLRQTIRRLNEATKELEKVDKTLQLW